MLFPFSMKRPATAALNACVVLRSKWHKRQKEETVTSYCEAQNYLLETYASYVIIAELDAEMIRFTQPSSKPPRKFDEDFSNRALRCNRVFDEYVHKGKFIVELPKSIRHSMRSYWGSKKNVTVHHLARHATLETKLQHGPPNLEILSHSEQTENPLANKRCRDGNVNNTKSSSSTLNRLSQNSFCNH